MNMEITSDNRPYQDSNDFVWKYGSKNTNEWNDNSKDEYFTCKVCNGTDKEGIIARETYKQPFRLFQFDHYTFVGRIIRYCPWCGAKIDYKEYNKK